MVRLLRLPAAFLLLALLAPSALAQSMVQLSFRDLAPAVATTGETPVLEPVRIEIEAGAKIGEESRQILLSLQLAPGTTAADLCELIAKRYERAGFDVLAPSPDRRTVATRGTVFLMDALFVNMRLLGPIAGTLTTCEGAPKSLRVRPPSARSAAGNLTLVGTLKHPSKDEVELLNMVVPLKVGMHPAQISEKLHTTAMERKLLSERPQGDSWQPVRTTEGALVTGLTIDIEGRGDWRLEVKL